ncbi:MAG: 1-acyl-sn-glycerol-3-phosphate acyltransferase [Firmicutes bacterium]|nr:1-acyl-sn-glycerol-3-phosphate acyltransferase [Bacillota bacterium]
MNTETHFIDADGIERPINPHAHMFEMPIKKVKPITKKRQVLNDNPVLFLLARIFQTIIFSILWIFFKIKYRLKIENKKAYKFLKGKGAVVICNHCHMLDVVAVRLVTMGRTNYMCSIAENFAIPFLGGLIKMLGAIPIPNTMEGMRYYKEVIDEQLQKCRMVSLMPEASMWPFYRALRPFKNGAFRFAVQNKVPVLPSCISMVYKHNKKGKIKRVRLTYTFFKPIYPDCNLSEREAVEVMMNKAQTVMKERIEQQINIKTMQKESENEKSPSGLERINRNT